MGIENTKGEVLSVFSMMKELDNTLLMFREWNVLIFVVFQRHCGIFLTVSFMNELNDGADEEGSVGDLYTGNFDSDSHSSLPNHAAHRTSSITCQLVTTRASTHRKGSCMQQVSREGPVKD